MTDLEAGPGDLAICCGGACGTDLIFAEQMFALNVALEIYLPFDVAEFLAMSVETGGAGWRQRFDDVCHRASLDVMSSATTDALASPESLYERNNLRMLKRALSFGADKLECICVCDGKADDGPGGTEHLVTAIREAGGRPYIIEPRAV
ncbi:MAG: hypothetical protein CPDRYMAC_6378 [uncultured Paraburkholderia sp.]|nr:MAG: hypothetical protein CPDRYDRY_6284 [uncultured Paraburkholderia sp.]CAH2944205.1 MAG: hypothetical protein CPDRYMAC_6378 [uncultured Paraburkholderia sp.]